MLVSTFFKNSRLRPRPWYQGLETKTLVLSSRDQDWDLGTDTSICKKLLGKCTLVQNQSCITFFQTVVYVHTPTILDMVLVHFLCSLKFLCTLTMQITELWNTILDQQLKQSRIRVVVELHIHQVTDNIRSQPSTAWAHEKAHWLKSSQQEQMLQERKGFFPAVTNCRKKSFAFLHLLWTPSTNSTHCANVQSATADCPHTASL